MRRTLAGIFQITKIVKLGQKLSKCGDSDLGGPANCGSWTNGPGKKIANTDFEMIGEHSARTARAAVPTRAISENSRDGIDLYGW